MVTLIEGQRLAMDHDRNEDHLQDNQVDPEKVIFKQSVSSILSR
jgi:hypothetical protein